MKEQKGIYIITDGNNFNKCKVGFHTGNIPKLIKRYITSLPNMNIIFYIQTKNNELENDIKSKFESNRILNINNNISEWYNIDYNKIIKFILENNKFEKINVESKIIQDSIKIKELKNEKRIIIQERIRKLGLFIDSIDEDDDRQKELQQELTNLNTKINEINLKIKIEKN